MAVSMIGPKFYAWDRNGKPLAFGKIYTYQARTNAPKPTYQSEDQVAENTNPVILNGEGYANIYLDGSYKIVLKDKDENEIWSADPVSAAQPDEWVNCLSATYVSPTEFKVNGNFASVYDPGRRVRVDSNAAQYEYSTIITSVFAGGETTVTLLDAIVTTGIQEVCVSIVGHQSRGDGQILSFGNLEDAVEYALLRKGDAIDIKERLTGKGGGSLWDVVETSSVTVNGFNVVQSNGNPLLSLKLREGNNRNALAWGFDPGLDADNDDVCGAFFADINDGDRVDFDGNMFRVFANTTGIPSSGANPATDRAQDLDKMAFLNGKKNINFSPGGLYAANQGTAPAKNYFPSTLYLKACEGIHFERGSIFEGKGGSWGDSDASVSLSKDDRQDFLGQNGGHAIVTCRCKRITGTPTTRLCGSVAPFYASSTQGVDLTDPFSNSASLGYASYAFDAWVGNVAATGLDNYHGNISNPQAYKETILRREDGLQAGSSIYSGKGGVLTEDADVEVATQGGYIADMYGNGSAKELGYAFGAGVHSLCTNVGAIVRNCQEVVYTNVSANGTAECRVTDVDAVVGLTGVMIDNQSFGVCKATLKGKVRVNNSRVWAGEVETLGNTSLVACMKPASNAFVTIDCDAAPDDNPPAGKSGSIFALISNKNEATYGGVIIEGGEYVINGYLIRSEGWGGAIAGTKQGLVIKPGVRIECLSTAATDGFIQYRNKSSGGGVFTYIYHDIEGADITVQGFRSLNSGYQIFGGGLVELQLFPKQLGESTYSNSWLDRPRETVAIECTSIDGLSGPNSLISFVMSDGRPIRTDSWITSNTTLVKVLGIQSITVAGPLRSQLLLEGDVRSIFTPLNNYTALGA